jgi:hypothetical protein
VTRSMLKQPGAIFNPIQMTMNVAGAAQEAAV